MHGLPFYGIKQNQMRYILIIMIIGFIGTNCYSQGSWDIGYVEIDSLSSENLNVPIKLDFKHYWAKMKEPQKKHIRHFVTPEDIAYLSINNNKAVLIEKRAIYIDHGSFNDQFLEIENYYKNGKRRIYDTEILQMEEDRIKVRVLIQCFKLQNGETKEELESETVEFWIEKDKLDGIMIKE